MKKQTPIILHADKEKSIVSQPYRTPPPQFRKELSEHLQFLRENGKIVDVDPNTEEVDAVSNVVLTRKPSGQMRMNLDARPVNAAMKDIATPHMATPEDVRHRLSGSTRFTEFDMNHGYNQSTLSEESSKKYGVFQTHEGFHRFKGLYFGHNQATQAFNEDVKKSLRGLTNAESVADNILIHSKTADNHKKHLIEFLDRVKDEGITLSMEKVNACKEEVLWFGHVYGKNGVRPDPAKVQKLKEKGVPCNQEEVRSFLQAAQFNARFMWNTDGAYSDITQPLRTLLAKKTQFVWGTAQQSSYEKIIKALESAGSLYPYDPELEIRHVADAQPTGIASSVYMVTKDADGEETWWPLNHISRSLTKTETGYPQIDRESLAQAWGMKQNRFYLLGRNFISFTDHRPLLPFYNAKKKPTPRVEKHILWIQDLKYEMKYMPGKDNPTDWNSRHPEVIEDWTEEEKRKHNVDNGEEIRLNRVVAVRKLDKILSDAGIRGNKPCSLEKIIEVGQQDKDYSATKHLVEQGKHNEVKGEYKVIANELSVCEDLLMKGGKIVIPKGEDGSIRRDIMEAAHEGHPGLTKMKSYLRSSVYWPSYTAHIDDEYKYCLACQATTTRKCHNDLLQPNSPPDRVWSKVGGDHWGPLPDGSGRHILVVQDYLSKYPEALLVSGTGAKDNIRALEEIFGRHGYPEKMITDNGPPWNGKENHSMQQYLEWAGVSHVPTQSADDPEANGLVERFMQTLEKSWETAVVDNVDPLAALNQILKTYRNTEHFVTKRKPAEWLFGRPIRTRIPDIRIQTQRDDKESRKAKENMKKRATEEKERHDKKAREEQLEVGMKVILKGKIKKKGKPKYDPEPYTIIEIQGRQAVLRRGDTTIRRETQKFKRLYTKEDNDIGQNNRQTDDWEDRISHRAKTDAVTGVQFSEAPQAAIATGPSDTDTATRDGQRRSTDIDSTINPQAPTRLSTRTNNRPSRYGSWVEK